MIVKNFNIIVLIFIFGLTSTLIADASIPVNYKCCKNYTDSNGVQLSNFENNDWIGPSQEADTVHFIEGQRGLKLIAPTGSAKDPSYPDASETESDLAINNDFSNVNNFVIWAYINNETDLNWIRLYVTSNNYASFYYAYNAYNFRKGWNKIVFNKQDFSNVFNENWNNVMTGMRIRIGDYSGKIDVTFDDLRYNISGKKAKLMIEFDDGYYNIYSNAFPILNANNQTGVSYVVTSYVGSGDINYMDISRLKILQSAGWDISSHTVSHPDLTSVDDSTQISELNNSYEWLVKNNFQKSAGFIAYPYGYINDAVTDKVEKRYVLGRSVARGAAQQHLISDHAIQYIQRITEVYSDTSPQEVKDKINDTIKAKLLGILLFHSIGDSQHDPYDYSKTNLKEVSDYLKSRSSDIDVITNSDYVIAYIKNFTPVINKTTRIYSNGSSVLLTNNKYDEYMPNMTVKPSSGSIDIGITAYNETGGLIRFNENSPNSNVQVSYEIGDRIPNKLYSVKIYWVNGTKYQEFSSPANSTGFIKYD